MKHDNDTIVRDICIATGAVTAACIASLATTAKYLFHFCIDTQWKTFRFPSIADCAGAYRKTSAG